MRVLLVLTLLPALLRAGEREEVLAQAERLAAPALRERHDANMRLLEMGDRIIPILRDIAHSDPEVRRFLRAMLRRTRKLRLSVVAPAARHPIGTPLRLEVHLLNETEDTYVIPLNRRSNLGHGTKSTFLVKVGGKELTLRPDQVEILSRTDAMVILRPGNLLRVMLKMAGEDSPLRKPGMLELEVGYHCDQMLRHLGAPTRPQEIEQEVVGVRLVFGPIRLRAFGRSPRELAAALQAFDRNVRTSALQELRLRNDAAALPLLRRFADDPDLRLSAVRRLGEAARLEDLDLLRGATRDPRREVRLEAVTALGNYTHRKAHSRLLILAQDHELKAAAVAALVRHKHPSTIDAFARLLSSNAGEAWVEQIQKTLYDWTGKHVGNRRGEIAAFERWWVKNREAWTRKQISSGR